MTPILARILPGLLALILLAAPALPADADGVSVILPRNSLEAHELGVVANSRDPQSLEIAKYYMRARNIPRENLVTVDFDPATDVMEEETFRGVKAQVDAGLPSRVQALALAWTRPFRVECMSVTSAFAFGFDRGLCAQGPELTRYSEYFASESDAPFTDHGVRPTMLLAGRSTEEVKELIRRGVASDGSRPQGAAYLIETGDKSRDVRGPQFEGAVQGLSDVLAIERLRTPGIMLKSDVMFYFTGTPQVPFLETLAFRPGAVADHLTSGGGVLSGGAQTSVLDWLEAGATGSYGTVAEPYNFPAKFPHVGVLMDQYLRGKTLIEAYWKSVAMPGQGLFVGEPLARPYGGAKVTQDGERLTIETMALAPGAYRIYWSTDGLPPYVAIEHFIQVRRGLNTITVQGVGPGYYFIEKD